MENNLLNLVMKRRSVRKFKDDKPSKDLIEKILHAGLLAPSSKNKKPIEFIVVADKDTLLKLKDCKSKGGIGLETAPCAIVVIGDSEKSDVWVEDASITASYMQLAAEELGLGTVWIQMRKRFSDSGDSENEVRKLLNIPENYGVLCILAVGFKNENTNSYNINNIDASRIHNNKFSN